MRLLVAIATSAFVFAGCADTSGVEPFAPPSEGDGAAADATPRDLSVFGVNGDPFVGNPNATVQVVSYEAPGCSSCKYYHFSNLPGVLQDYVDTDLIGYHFLQYTVNYPYDISGGIAAECAHREGGSLAYVHIMDLIFDDQEPSRLQEYVDDTVATFGLDSEQVNACVDGRETENEVYADIQAGRDSGAGSNPGFAIVSDKGVEIIHGRQGPRAAIDRALA